MKYLVAIIIFLTPTIGWGLEHIIAPIAPLISVVGVVQETVEVENFTYLRLKTKDNEVWAAVINSRVTKGDHVTLENVTVMKNFESKSLKKVFPTVLFGSLVSSGGPKSASSGVEKYISIAHPGFAKTSNTPSTRQIPH